MQRLLSLKADLVETDQSRGDGSEAWKRLRVSAVLRWVYLHRRKAENGWVWARELV